MADVHVSCIVKTHHHHEGITHIGGLGGDGWCWPIENVISSIDAGTNTFYTLVNGKRANIHPHPGPSGRRHLRTDADNTPADNLLSLPSCRR